MARCSMFTFAAHEASSGKLFSFALPRIVFVAAFVSHTAKIKIRQNVKHHQAGIISRVAPRQTCSVYLHVSLERYAI